MQYSTMVNMLLILILSKVKNIRKHTRKPISTYETEIVALRK